MTDLVRPTKRLITWMIGFGDYTVVSMIVSAGDYNDVVSIGRYAHPNPSRPFSRTSLETNKRDVPSHTFFSKVR